MRKVLLLAALLAMVLATAAPAFAQTAVGGDTVVLQYSCNQIQAALDLRAQSGLNLVTGVLQHRSIPTDRRLGEGRGSGGQYHGQQRC